MPCPVEVQVRRGRVVYRAGDEGGGGSSERAQAGATAGSIGGEKVGGTEGGAGERSEGARVWTHSATSVTEEVWVAHQARYIARWEPNQLGGGGR